MKPAYTGVKYDRTPAELQQYILTCILAGGKTASDVEKKVNAVTAEVPDGTMPCDHLLQKANLKEYLQCNRTGMYQRLMGAISQITQLDLKTATVEELRTIPGVGPKTSRLFLLRSRRNVSHAAIDTHTLKFLRSNGVSRVPEKTPVSDCEYLRLEAELLRLFAEKYPDLTPAEADAKVWESYRR